MGSKSTDWIREELRSQLDVPEDKADAIAEAFSKQAPDLLIQAMKIAKYENDDCPTAIFLLLQLQDLLDQ
ncbi:MAG: hypothetical protein F4Z29_01245 [Gemmatimonadetes bacterium]|nr:hypothetical protein [Gemmatimonadota bacterium]